MLMNKEQVLNFMPHRPPFLFIDTVTKVDIPEEAQGKEGVTSKDLVGSHVIANFSVREDLEILKGHFPGNPILPGVVQVEMMAQASAFVSLGLNGLDSDEYKVETLLLGVESSKFRKPVLPGMDLEIHAIMDKSRGPIAHYKCEIFSEGVKISEAKILAKLNISKRN
jgi:3-hydroxyacyl-[acyl-carrier-protein] dehydratase